MSHVWIIIIGSFVYDNNFDLTYITYYASLLLHLVVSNSSGDETGIKSKLKQLKSVKNTFPK